MPHEAIGVPCVSGKNGCNEMVVKKAEAVAKDICAAADKIKAMGGQVIGFVEAPAALPGSNTRAEAHVFVIGDMAPEPAPEPPISG